jgi:hypothetical protein
MAEAQDVASWRRHRAKKIGGGVGYVPDCDVMAGIGAEAASMLRLSICWLSI